VAGAPEASPVKPIAITGPEGAKLAFVGLAPARGFTGPALASGARTGERLEDLLGCPVHDVALTANVLERHDAPRTGEAAWERGTALREELERRRPHRVVILGMDAARLMGLRWGRGDSLWFRWEWDSTRGGLHYAGLYYAVAPHPSGRSRWWNNPENVERARAFFRELVAREKGREG
jgi:uracil-DNA glycosylase